MDFRHEYKFIISVPQSLILRERLKSIMREDVHAKELGGYEIRSIYFDDISHTCFLQNEAGTDPRAKYRIRSYNCSKERIVLEKKIKANGMTKKLQTDLSLKQYELLIQPFGREAFCETVWGEQADFYSQPPLVQELLMLKQTRRMEPKVIVAYERLPFVETAGNVRVTFDDHISSGNEIENFFEAGLHKRPVMPSGSTLMEVKFDEFLPAYIREALEIGRLSQTTFSKYYLCRRYSL